MKTNDILVVLTDNTWLHAGLTSLMPEMRCHRSGFRDCDLPPGLEEASQVIVAVDCLIFLTGEWATFYQLIERRPDTAVIWLTRDRTGLLFPEGRREDRMVNQKKDIVSLRSVLFSGGERNTLPVTSLKLTRMENALLPCFLSGINVPQLSVLSEISERTLYIHRKKIVQKAGFGTISFLRYVYDRNFGAHRNGFLR